jgi:hypothetical protein
MAVLSPSSLLCEQQIQLLFQSGVDLFLFFKLLPGYFELVARLLAEAGGSLLDPIRAQRVEKGRGKQKENDERQHPTESVLLH